MKEYKPDETSRSLASSRQSRSGRDDSTVQTGETRYTSVDMCVLCINALQENSNGQ